jgi:hypothetical protein
MKTLFGMVSAVALTVALAGTAGAVDLASVSSIGDGPYYDSTVTVTENGQSRKIVVTNGEIIRNLCDSCTISMGGKEVQASGNDSVEMSGSSLTLLQAKNGYMKPSAKGRGADLVSASGIGDGPYYDTNVTIIENGQSRQLTLANGEMIRDVCTSCTIKFGGKEVQASANDTVHLSGSSVAVARGQTQVARLPASAEPEHDGTVDASAQASPHAGPEGSPD